MNKGFDKIKQAWDDNPIGVLIVGAFVATAASKVLDARSSARNSRAWQREVDRRIMMKNK